MILSVHILGSGSAARKHREAFEKSPHYRLTGYDKANIIDICTPNCQHFQQAIDAMKSGKDVIVEKPIAHSLEAIHTLRGFEAMCDAKIFPVFNYRYLPITGDEVSQWRRSTAYYSGWRGDIAQAFGGCIVSHTIHTIDRYVYQLGLPEWVVCSLDTDEDYDPTVEHGATIALYYGEDDYYIIDHCISPTAVNMHLTNPGFDDLFRRIAEEPDTVNLEDAERTMMVVTACYHSAIIKDKVMLPIGPDHPLYSGWQKPLARHLRKSVSSH